MQSNLQDSKLQILYNNYRDKNNVKQATKEVEGIRKNAIQKGVLTSAAVFGLNEVIRVTNRSRK